MFLTFYRFIIVRILLGMNKVQSRVCRLLPLAVGCVVGLVLVAVVLALFVVVVHLVVAAVAAVAAVAVLAATDPLAVHPVLVQVAPGPVAVAVGFDDDRAGDDGADMVPCYQT